MQTQIIAKSQKSVDWALQVRSSSMQDGDDLHALFNKAWSLVWSYKRPSDTNNF